MPIRVNASLYNEGAGLRLSRQPIARVIGKILFLTYAVLRRHSIEAAQATEAGRKLISDPGFLSVLRSIIFSVR